MSRAALHRAVLAGALALALAGCAPPPRPAPSVDDVAARYRAGRDRRAAAVHALTADLVLRLDGRATGRLPGLPATLALAAPERARVRVGSLFGTALDVLARGDSVLAWVPSERTVLALAGAAETLGVAPPVTLLARALAATWDPPRDAWRAATADTQGVRVAWLEDGDTLALVVDGDARPAELRLAGTVGSVTVRYAAWGREAGADWPGSVELADGTGWVRARIGISNVRPAAAADEAWFAQRLPAGAKRLDWEGLQAWLRSRRSGD